MTYLSTASVHEPFDVYTYGTCAFIKDSKLWLVVEQACHLMRKQGKQKYHVRGQYTWHTRDEYLSVTSTSRDLHLTCQGTSTLEAILSSDIPPPPPPPTTHTSCSLSNVYKPHNDFGLNSARSELRTKSLDLAFCLAS